jgi:DNA-directed RNA polymerase subunit L
MSDIKTFKPDITDIQRVDDELKFIISGDDEYGLDVSLINSIRRILLTEIPTVGFKLEENGQTNDIIINENNSSLHNEMLLHRIALLPLYINPINYMNNYLFKCDIQHNNDNQFTFVTAKNIDIYQLKDHLLLKIDKYFDKSSDMNDEDKKLFKDQLNEMNQENYNLDKPLSDKEKEKIFKPFIFRNQKNYCLLNELKTTNTDNISQSLNFYGVPSIGYGKYHANFQSVSQATYSYLVNEDLLNEKIEDSIRINKISDEEQANYRKDFILREGERYYYRDNFGESNKYLFSLKSNHYYDENSLFKLSINILKDKFINFKLNIVDHLKNNNDNNIELQTKSEYIYIVKINNEDHTLGNLFQKFISKNYIDNDSFISSLSYKKPHPLEDNIIFIISLSKNHKLLKELNEINKINKIFTIIIENIDKLVDDINILLKVSEKKL